MKNQKPMTWTLLFLAAGVITLSSCSSPSTEPSTSQDINTPEPPVNTDSPFDTTIQAGEYTLPPDPGEIGKSTLRGVDSNGNGVRDDVERYIEQSNNLQTTKNAFSQMAIALDQVMVASLQDDPEVNFEAVRLVSNAKSCLALYDRDTSPGSYTRASEKMLEITQIYFNTQERLDADFTVTTNIPFGKTTHGFAEGQEACTN